MYYAVRLLRRTPLFMAAALAAIALAAIYIPARRGIHLDPAVALRVE